MKIFISFDPFAAPRVILSFILLLLSQNLFAISRHGVLGEKTELYIATNGDNLSFSVPFQVKVNAQDFEIRDNSQNGSLIVNRKNIDLKKQPYSLTLNLVINSDSSRPGKPWEVTILTYMRNRQAKLKLPLFKTEKSGKLVNEFNGELVESFLKLADKEMYILGLFDLESAKSYKILIIPNDETKLDIAKSSCSSVATHSLEVRDSSFHTNTNEDSNIQIPILYQNRKDAIIYTLNETGKLTEETKEVFIKSLNLDKCLSLEE